MLLEIYMTKEFIESLIIKNVNSYRTRLLNYLSLILLSLGLTSNVGQVNLRTVVASISLQPVPLIANRIK